MLKPQGSIRSVGAQRLDLHSKNEFTEETAICIPYPPDLFATHFLVGEMLHFSAFLPMTSRAFEGKPTAMHSHAIICRMSMCMKLVGPVMAGEFVLQGTAAEAEEVLKLARSSSANIHAELLRAKATAVLEDQDGPGWTMTCLRSSKFNLF